MKIKTLISGLVSLVLCLVSVCSANAGIYNPPYPSNDGISMNDSSIKGWATGWEHYNPGSGVTSQWQTPFRSLGEAVGDSFDIVSLGDGGSITMTFDAPIVNGPGADFAVFENSFSDTFLELAYVEVSSNGIDFVRFDNMSLTSRPTSSVNAEDIFQLAGKYRQGIGTPFDLGSLLNNVGENPSILDLNNINYIRLVDVIGDGANLHTLGGPIFDPLDTYRLAAGFDLDAVAVLNQGTAPPAPVPLPGGMLLLGSGILGLAGLRRKRG